MAGNLDTEWAFEVQMVYGLQIVSTKFTWERDARIYYSSALGAGRRAALIQLPDTTLESSITLRDYAVAAMQIPGK